MSEEGKVVCRELSPLRGMPPFKGLNFLRGYRSFKYTLLKASFLKAKPSKATFFKVFLSVASFYLVCTVITTYTHLGECASDSLQGVRYALFLKTSSSKTPSLKRGDIVLIHNHPLAYGGYNTKDIKDKRAKNKGEVRFAKRLLGMPGDLLSQEQFKALPLLERTKGGDPLTPLKANIVPAGYVFVAGDHPRSFDSRYEEFGFVPLDKIWGKAILAW